MKVCTAGKHGRGGERAPNGAKWRHWPLLPHCEKREEGSFSKRPAGPRRTPTDFSGQTDLRRPWRRDPPGPHSRGSRPRAPQKTGPGIRLGFFHYFLGTD